MLKGTKQIRACLVSEISRDLGVYPRWLKCSKQVMNISQIFTFIDNASQDVVISGYCPNEFLRAVNLRADFAQPLISSFVFFASTGKRDISGNKHKMRRAQSYMFKIMSYIALEFIANVVIR